MLSIRMIGVEHLLLISFDGTHSSCYEVRRRRFRVVIVVMMVQVGSLAVQIVEADASGAISRRTAAIRVHVHVVEYGLEVHILL